MIRPVRPSDAASIADIYNHYIENTVVTFECEPIDAATIQARIEKTTTNFPYLCFVDPKSEELMGYAYAGPWRERIAFRFTVETSIYVRDGHKRQGIGRRLAEELFQQLRDRKIRNVIASIATPNEASIASHKAFGFSQIGVFPNVGFKFDRWIDVEFWQLEL